MTRKYRAQILCLKDFTIALPKRDLVGKKGEVVTANLKVAKILQKNGYAEIIRLVRVEEE